MAKICRTCLQKSNQTFKTNQTLGDFGGGEVRISLVLRFCIPELYLGLSTNPEICYDCKEHLKVAYLFKKKCLNTENIIGNFLKNARCTAQSVELHDVVAYLDDSVKSQLEAEKGKQTSTLNAQDILSEWEEQPDNELISTLKDNALEVRQSAPNPTNSRDTDDPLRFCEQTGLFVNCEGNSLDFAGNSANKNQAELESTESKLRERELTKPKLTEPDTVNEHRKAENIESGKITDVGDKEIKEPQINTKEDVEPSTENFFKITSVFSLSETADAPEVSKQGPNDSNVKIVDCVTEKTSEDVSTDNDANEGLINIKSEPLDIEINGECIDFNYNPTDEDTLDASETASYENMQCNSNLQGIIDNIPEINDNNQYVDIPEFVHINNFGLKELEELRQQQMNQVEKKNKEEKTTILNFENKIAAPKISNSFNLTKIENKPQDGKNRSVLIKTNAKLPDVLFINGKKMVKCSDGYRVAEESSPLLKSILNSGATATVETQATVEAQETSIYCKPITFDGKVFNKIPEIIYFGGKKYIKSSTDKGFKYVPEGCELTQIEKPVPLKLVLPKETGKVQDLHENPILPAFPNTDRGNNVGFLEENLVNNADSQETDLNITETVDSGSQKRKRRKLKIVPVSDNKYVLTQQKVKIIPKVDDKDVVVLFTNYTMDGSYINDHDYLVNPYKRNKVLVEEGDKWFCMCYICHTRHRVSNHVSHMIQHGSMCKICKMDLGTPYMLNVHVRGHAKPCRLCTERVPYGLMETHELQHFEEERQIEIDSKKKVHRKRKTNKDEKSIYFPTQRNQSVRKSSCSEELGDRTLGNVTPDEVSSHSEKKSRGKKRKNANESSPTVERSGRVLRSNRRKSCSETDNLDEVKGSDAVEGT